MKFHGQALVSSKEIIAGKETWYIPEEVPVAFVFNKRNYAIMMGTPQDLVDFAIGFSLTEDVIRDQADINSLDIYLSEQGADLRFNISDEALERLDIVQRRRNIIGSASCGLCGLENAETLFKKLPRVSEKPLILDEAVTAKACLLYTSPSPRDATLSRMPSSA